ncbi:MAG: ATP-binding cassette domain-containing protein, partial [Burkholderiales bacterium]
MADEAPQFRIERLTMAYGDRVVQRAIDFAIGRGERFVIMGDSGCGKSTLLKHMIGLIEPAAGRILFEDVDLWQLGERDRNRLLRRFGVLY